MDFLKIAFEDKSSHLKRDSGRRIEDLSVAAKQWFFKTQSQNEKEWKERCIARNTCACAPM